MQVRIISNVWLDGRVLVPGTVIDINDAERLCKLGAAERVPVSPAVTGAEGQTAPAPVSPAVTGAEGQTAPAPAAEAKKPAKPRKARRR